MPPKKSALKKSTKKGTKKAKVIYPGPGLSPTPSEQEILDAIPQELGRLPKSADAVSNAYLIYVVLQTNLDKPAKVVIRKSYESQFEALEAFIREYQVWTTGTAKSGIFPACHTNAQFEKSKLINELERSTGETEELYKTTMPLKVHLGGRVEYSLIHRDDMNLDVNDPRKRTCTIVCEQTTYEAAYV